MCETVVLFTTAAPNWLPLMEIKNDRLQLRYYIQLQTLLPMDTNNLPGHTERETLPICRTEVIKNV